MCSKCVLRALPVSSYETLKRWLLECRGWIKLIILTALSRTYFRGSWPFCKCECTRRKNVTTGTVESHCCDSCQRVRDLTIAVGPSVQMSTFQKAIYQFHVLLTIIMEWGSITGENDLKDHMDVHLSNHGHKTGDNASWMEASRLKDYLDKSCYRIFRRTTNN